MTKTATTATTTNTSLPKCGFMDVGHSFEILMSMGPRKLLVGRAVGMAFDEPGEDISQMGERIYIVQFTDFDQSSDDGSIIFGSFVDAPPWLFTYRAEGSAFGPTIFTLSMRRPLSFDFLISPSY